MRCKHTDLSAKLSLIAHFNGEMKLNIGMMVKREQRTLTAPPDSHQSNHNIYEQQLLVRKKTSADNNGVSIYSSWQSIVS